MSSKVQIHHFQLYQSLLNCKASNDSKNVEIGKERVTNHCSDDSDTVHKEINIERWLMIHSSQRNKNWKSML